MFIKKGLFVVTGCGHAGIVNKLEHFRNITGISTIYGIMGGFICRFYYFFAGLMIRLIFSQS